MTYDQWGLRRREGGGNPVGYDMWRVDTACVEGMRSPVRCAHCRGVYDMGKVTVTARYTDCSVWRSPCCGLTVDDRGAGWKVRADYVELDRDGREVRR